MKTPSTRMLSVFAATLVVGGLLTQAAAAKPYDVTVLDDSPTAYWRLGEAKGSTDAADESDTGYSGTYQNANLDQYGSLVYEATRL